MANDQKPTNSLAKNIGHLFAHVQDGIDFFVELGFKALKNAGQEKPTEKVEEEKTHPALNKAKTVGKTALKFVGDTGDAFYTKYEELKRMKEEKE